LLHQPGSFEIDNVSVRAVNGHTGTITGATIQTEAPKQIYALPPVDNTKSLNFDGTNDHLITQVDSAAQPNNESRYYSWWSKATRTTHNPVFDHGNAQKGAFHFNHSSGRPLLWMANTVYKYWNDNSAQDSGAWAHWVLRISTNSINDCQLWCNGVELTNASTVNTGSMNTYDTGIRIGRGGGTYFEGSIDEFSIHEDLDEEAIRALYNRGRPIDVSSGNGAYDLSDKALHWWRMGDATSPAADGSADGTNDILFQGFSEEGSELLTNNGFDSDSDWSKGSGWTISNGTAIHTGGGSYLSQDVMVAGRTYEMSFDIVSLTDPSSDFVQPYFNQSPALGLFRSVGRHTVVGTAVEGALGAALRATGDIVIDNVSVKQLRGQYIGPELVRESSDLYIPERWFAYSGGGIDNVETFPNGTAARFTRPSSGGGPSGGFINLATGSTVFALTQNLETGCVYRLSFDFLTDDDDGNCRPRYNDGTSYTELSLGSGTKVFYFVYSGSTSTFINASGVSPNKFVQFSNLSVTKVGAAASMTNMDPASDIQTDTPY